MSRAELLAHLALLGIRCFEYNSSIYKLTNLIHIHVGGKRIYLLLQTFTQY